MDFYEVIKNDHNKGSTIQNNEKCLLYNVK